MNFLLFNIILFSISYLLDYIGMHVFGIIEWSETYIYYLVLLNIPLSFVLTYIVMKRVKELVK